LLSRLKILNPGYGGPAEAGCLKMFQETPLVKTFLLTTSMSYPTTVRNIVSTLTGGRNRRKSTVYHYRGSRAGFDTNSRDLDDNADLLTG